MRISRLRDRASYTRWAGFRFRPGGQRCTRKSANPRPILRRVALLPPIVVAAALCAGCWQPPRPSVQQLDRGLIWLFPGVEGGAWSLEGPYRSFRAEGIDAAIYIHDWWKPFGTLINLTSYKQNRADAARVAADIAAYRKLHPEAPLDLVGYSGGGGIAIMTAEALPPEVELRNIVLVQPALSPDYDLTSALRHVQGTLVNHYCAGDWWTLGLGTSALGTMDRKYTPSAGKDGFVLEKAVPDERQRAHFVQRPWGREAAQAGHAGMHLGIMGYEWNRRFVAPDLKRPTATPATVTERLPKSVER